MDGENNFDFTEDSFFPQIINDDFSENFALVVPEDPICFEGEDLLLGYSPPLAVDEMRNPNVYEQSSLSTPEYNKLPEWIVDGRIIQHPPSGSNIKVEESSSTSFSLQSVAEERVNLNELKEETQSTDLNVDLGNSPLLVISLSPWAGYYDLNVEVPKPNMQGVKPKYVWSDMLKKVFVARNTAFPVNISMNSYPPGAILQFCPVYTKSEHRMKKVIRCPNCMMADTNPEVNRHVVRVEGSKPTYFFQDSRAIVSVPLERPAPGSSFTQVFLKIGCNTSCIGGPNRKDFCVLMTLKFQNREVGRQIIYLKCCEGPLRDMGTEEKKQKELQEKEQKVNLQEKESQNRYNIEMVKRIASDMSVSCRKEKPSLKRKRAMTEKVEEVEDIGKKTMIMIPEKYVKKVKKYVNELYRRDYYKKNGGPVIFTLSNSESD